MIVWRSTGSSSAVRLARFEAAAAAASGGAARTRSRHCVEVAADGVRGDGIHARLQVVEQELHALHAHGAEDLDAARCAGSGFTRGRTTRFHVSEMKLPSS